MEDKTFELLEKMYSDLTGRMYSMEQNMATKQDIARLEGRVTIIEEDHGRKLDLLLDGYKQNSDKLDRIEREVTRQEEIILRKIK